MKDTYGENSVTKRECIGHVQKRVGKRLRKLKKTEKGLGRLGLNDATIDKLQNYYGIAVRSNLKSVEDMKRGIYATWCHVASSAKDNFHHHFPDGSKSWCLYKRDIANDIELYNPGKGLPKACQESF